MKTLSEVPNWSTMSVWSYQIEREIRERAVIGWKLKSKISQLALIRVLSFWSLPFTNLFWSKKRENKHSDSNRRFAQDIDLKAREQFERKNKREKKIVPLIFLWTQNERERTQERSPKGATIFFFHMFLILCVTCLTGNWYYIMNK